MNDKSLTKWTFLCDLEIEDGYHHRSEFNMKPFGTIFKKSPLKLIQTMY